ncbi:hypothetical protein [Bartonella australis]|nr:hypothetical protein [Bartonella australis]
MVTQKCPTKTLTLVDYLSHSAAKLLDIHAMLLKVKKENVRGSSSLMRQLDTTKKQLDEISYALILEYRKRQENERFLKQILMSISDRLSALNSDFKESGRLLFQEIRILQSQMQCFYESGERQLALNDSASSGSPSKIDEVIKQLQKAREDLALESPHLFGK